ncbi:diguanylate cyclase [Marinobacter sp.]|uniref:sensor domain-containing diguanylate cyclase n=1 Tax=Marinobacter sp. TaxID=50741 RepID=UPI00356500D8
MDNNHTQGTALGRSLKIAMAYLVTGALWILFSDAALERLVSDPVTLSRLQTWKGWAFVLVTAAVLCLVLLRQLRRDREQLHMRKAQQEEILRLSQFQQGVIDNANVWLNVLDPNGKVLVWNRAAERISGYTSDEITGSVEIWQKLYPDPGYRAWVIDRVRGIVAGEEEVEGLETRILAKHNGERLISWNSRALKDSRGEVAGSIAIGVDITEQRAAENALKASERKLANLMDSLPGMAYRCLYDEFWTMKFVSSGCEELTGYKPEDLVDNRKVAWAELIEPGDTSDVLRQVEGAIGNASTFSVEYRIRRATGESIWVWERGRGVEDDHGMVLEGIVLDVTERKRLEERLSELATLDPLTGQFNRRETERILQEELVRAERYGRQLAVLWVDLDHFKRVNDSWGHAIGDKVLRTVSLRLADSVRTVDTLGRFGGEEFLVVLPEMSVAEACDTAERLRRRVASEPVPVAAEQSLEMTVSIGVAVYPDHGESADELCNRADKAMYLAKSLGRNRTEVYTPAPAEDLTSDGT